jgi:hypothetical protein
VKYTFPETYGTDEVLVPIDIALIPLVSGALKHFERPETWESDEAWQAGYNAFAELQVAMTGRRISDLIEAVDRQYRLIDTALNGTQYTSSANPADPARPIVSPEIPAAPGADIGQAPGLRAQLLAAQGTINAGWFGIGGQPATAADIVNALRVGSDADTDRITAAIDAIAGDSGLAQASQASNIFNTVKGLFVDVVDGVGEGAVLGTLIASSIATSGMLGVLAGQLDRLTASIDGGGLVGPSDNVLLALRGTTVANENRNIVDAVGGVNLVQLLDEVEALLIQIRDKVQ